MEIIEIPFGAKDFELQEWTYTIPDGMEAEIKDGKVIIKRKESEDERIRKAILGLTYLDGIEPILTKCSVTVQDIRKYLEKQKEQKPVEFFDEYKIIKKHITEDMLSSEVNKRLTECGWYVTDEKPAEWSEDDKFKLEDAITGIDVGIGFYEREGKHPNLLKAIVEAKEWLKSLRPQRKVEWSEEDLQHKSWILECLADGERKMPEYAEDFRAAYKWLKSLRPSWKPSDGQMAELNKVRTLNPGLDALYQQLKNM